MAKQVLNATPSVSTFKDAGLVALAKVGTEMANAPFVGNGTFISAGAKAVESIAAHKLWPKKYGGDYITRALIIDAAEDAVNALKNMFFGAKTQGSTDIWN